MKKKHIHILFTRFFENNYPGDVRDLFASWFVRPEQTGEKEEALKEIWDSLPVTTEFTSFEELKKINKRIHSRTSRFFRRLAATAAIIVLPLLGVITTKWYYKPAETVPYDVLMMECFVPNGERKHLTLSDGSTVWLNAGSILIYPEIFGEIRSIYLSGEGHFTVAQNEKKPFIVKTNYINVEALGTVFNVHAYPDENKTTTILKSGKIKVDEKAGTSEPVILTPNEQLAYNHTDASFSKSTVDATRLSTWTDGHLIFQQEALGSIFRSLERRYNIKINYNDSKFANMTFTVRFHADETLEEALDVLKRIGVNFKYKIKDKDVYVQ